jgi:hypothetical protein
LTPICCGDDGDDRDDKHCCCTNPVALVETFGENMIEKTSCGIF